MNRIDTAPLSYVARDVLTHSNDTVDGAQNGGLREALRGRLGSERNGDGRAHKINEARTRRSQCDLQEKLTGIVRGSNNDVRIELGDLIGEETSQVRIHR